MMLCYTTSMTKPLSQEEKDRRKRERQKVYNLTASQRKVAWAKAKRQRCRLVIFERYGGRCACCGLSDYRWLTLHHKNRDGGVERNHQKLNSANRLYHFIKQPKRDDLELLCYNCHRSLDFFGCCPHNDPSSPYFVAREAK